AVLSGTTINFSRIRHSIRRDKGVSIDLRATGYVVRIGRDRRWRPELRAAACGGRNCRGHLVSLIDGIVRASARRGLRELRLLLTDYRQNQVGVRKRG